MELDQISREVLQNDNPSPFTFGLVMTRNLLKASIIGMMSNEPYRSSHLYTRRAFLTLATVLRVLETHVRLMRLFLSHLYNPIIPLAPDKKMDIFRVRSLMAPLGNCGALNRHVTSERSAIIQFFSVCVSRSC